jgi:hypothetical protein
VKRVRPAVLRGRALFVNGEIGGGVMDIQSVSRHNCDWTQEEDELCSELWLKGVIARLIAEQLGRTPSAVRSRSQHLNLPQRHIGNNPRAKRPPHIRGEENTPEWYDSQQAAFVAAMEAYPSERPSEIPEERLGHVISLGLRIPSRPPSWSSMGDYV